MIVDCESCHTKFRLDEARIPAAGAKVRCSRCKTAFIVRRPAASHDEFIDEVVAEATNPAATRAPASTEDLFETSGTAAIGEAGGSDTSEASSDEKWEFDEAPPASTPRPEVATPKGESPTAAAAEAGNDLDALGSPEGWDLVGATPTLAAEARFDAPSAAREATPAVARASAGNAREPARAHNVESALAAAVLDSPRAEEPAGPGWLQTARAVAQHGIDSGVWIASVALCSVGLVFALTPQSESPSDASAASALTASLHGQSFAAARVAVESSLGGVLTVVRGQLPPSAGTREPLRLRATWLDTHSEPIPGASAIAGPPLAARKLREWSLARLGAEQEAHALELTAGGAFEAVFGALPAGAHGIALSQEPVPVAAPAATQSAASADAAATTSSRPTARLSSE